ncbi:putative integral membrane protein [Thermoplasmatales archaeon]|nr:putative integral membrane protein [Thermoplasmatales archaeon]
MSSEKIENKPEVKIRENEGGVPIEKWRLHFIAYAVIYINFAFVMWYLVGYLNIAALVSIWALLIISGVFILYAVAFRTEGSISKLLPLIAFSFALVVSIAAYLQFFPSTTTDEMIIDSYAAYLTIHGTDPYINANMANVFIHYKAISFLSTPLLSGGIVTYFDYPGLAALVFIPAILLGLPAFTVTIFFDIASLFLIFFYYKRKGFTTSLPVMALVMGLVAEYGIFSASGVTDVIWVFLLGVAYVFRKKPWVAGIFYGLSVAFKQIPALIFPFFLYFIYMENGGERKQAISFTGFTALSFFAINMPYIIPNASDWFVNITSIATLKIIGIGVGPSILSFTGVLHLPSEFFSISLIALTIALFFIYIIHYDRFKYGFFAFPIIIFLLDYRSLINYLIYWPFLVLLLLPDFSSDRTAIMEKQKSSPLSRHHFLASLEHSAIRNKKSTAVAIVILIFLATVVSAGFYYSQADSTPLVINSVQNIGDPFMVAGNVTYMQLNISYTPAPGDPALMALHYRILYSTLGAAGANGLMWYGSNPYVQKGYNSVDIYPTSSNSLLPATSTKFEVTAYGNSTSYLATYTYDKPISIPNTPINNPTLSFLTNGTGGVLFPGWTWESSLKGNYPLSVPNGIVMIANSSNQANPIHEALNSNINYTYLVSHNLSLNFNATAIKGSIVDNTSDPSTLFYGPVITLDSQYKFYIIYNNSAIPTNLLTQTTNATSYVFYTNHSSVNFRALNESIIAHNNLNKSINPVNNAVLSYVLNYDSPGEVTVEIGNLSLNSN